MTTEGKDYHGWIQQTVSFLHNEISQRGFQKVILGLSGGIDSAVVAALVSLVYATTTQDRILAMEIPIQNIEQISHLPILCVIMPSSSSSPQNIEDAKEIAQAFNLPYTIAPLIDFETSLKTLHPHIQQENPLRIGNACARFRMTVLYDLAFAQNRIVLGTTNKSERLLGYGTIYGDLAAGINPIGNIYKSDIFILAKHLKIPQHIITKPPSADLYEGQTDEKELGFSYADIDCILQDFFDHGFNKQMLLQKYSENAVNEVLYRHNSTYFKRETTPIAKGFK